MSYGVGIGIPVRSTACEGFFWWLSNAWSADNCEIAEKSLLQLGFHFR